MLKFLLEFDSFCGLNEAHSPRHFEKRVRERLINPLRFPGVLSFSIFPKGIKKDFSAEQIKYLDSKCSILFLKEIERRIGEVKEKNFSRTTFTAYPLMRMGLEYQGVYYPFEIYSRERDEKNPEIFKTYQGNQIWIPVNQDILATVKIFPPAAKRFEIDENCKDSIEREIRKELKPKDWETQPIPMNYEFTLAISRRGDVEAINYN